MFDEMIRGDLSHEYLGIVNAIGNALLDKFRQANKEKQTAVLGALLADSDSVADAVAGN